MGLMAGLSSVASFRAQKGLSALHLPLGFSTHRQILPMKPQRSTPGPKSIEKSNSYHNPRPASPQPRLGHVSEAGPASASRESRCIDRLGLDHVSTQAPGRGPKTRETWLPRHPGRGEGGLADGETESPSQTWAVPLHSQSCDTISQREPTGCPPDCSSEL